MAKVKGDVGQVKFDDAGSSVNPVLGTTSWSMSITKDTQEITAQGDTFKQFVGGFIDGALVTGDLGAAAFELFPDSSSATKKISFNGIITGFEQSSSLGDPNTISITFKPTGTITSAI